MYATQSPHYLLFNLHVTIPHFFILSYLHYIFGGALCVSRVSLTLKFGSFVTWCVLMLFVNLTSIHQCFQCKIPQTRAPSEVALVYVFWKNWTVCYQHCHIYDNFIQIMLNDFDFMWFRVVLSFPSHWKYIRSKKNKFQRRKINKNNINNTIIDWKTNESYYIDFLLNGKVKRDKHA